MRVLITGASGFVGSYLARACLAAGDEVIGLSRDPAPSVAATESLAIDLRDGDAVRTALAQEQPDIVYHLAALSSVGRSWEDPAATLGDNTSGAVNLLEAIRHEARNARVVWVSTCEVYGPPSSLPVTEDSRLSPANPYAVSKAAGELLARVYNQAHGIDIVVARPFNHAGPGQTPVFLVSSLARQAAAGRLTGAQRVRIVTGNPDARRDFSDVRDVVVAYRLLAERGPTDIYNVCSGSSISVLDQIELLGEILAPIEIEHVVDPGRFRTSDVMELRGAHDRLTAATGWQPTIPFRQTMTDTIAWWEQSLRSNPAAPPSARSNS